MDTKTKIQIIISLALVFLIGLLTYWIQLPAGDLKAQLIQESQTVLVRIQDFEFLPDVVKIDKGTVVSWLNDETDANAGVQHTVVSYDPDDSTVTGDLFQSGLLSQGDTFTQDFTEEGVFYYNCTLHPFMTGKVCVGAASEMDDPDCEIETTEATGTFSGDETETDDDGASPPALTLPPAETIGDETAGTDTENEDEDDDGETGLPSLEETPLLTINLQEAADEDYQGGASAGQTSSTSASTSTTVSASDKTSYPKTANSGPEDIIYLVPVLLSLFIAKRLSGSKV